MAMDWVQEMLKKNMGFRPFPATLNVRPKGEGDMRVWATIQTEWPGISLAPVDESFCSARLFRVDIEGPSKLNDRRFSGAVLLPNVAGYPRDKIEIVAPVRLKSVLGVEDGDELTLEFPIE
jgi:CTP-dependent riboflavin kinase